MKSERREWTALEVDHALKLRAMGFSWGEIAERLGRTRNGVTAYMSYLRSGKIRHPGNRPEWERRRQMIAMAEAGKSTREIADHFNMNTPHVSARLHAHGYDWEVREEIRRGLP